MREKVEDRGFADEAQAPEGTVAVKRGFREKEENEVD